MKIEHTERGFVRIDFKDQYGIDCSLQKSSLATEDCIWLGCNDADPKELISGLGWQRILMPKEYIANTRMHLTREQVKQLLPYLERFVNTGEIEDAS